MARFEPFLGLRYDDTVAPLSEVIAPPYDIVDAAERDELASRSPYNAIHLELPVPDGELDRYAHASALLERWTSEGVLQRDDAPSFYVYRMTFDDERGIRRCSTGVIGALGIDAAGEGSVLPHERTMPKPKGDRLDLLRATRTNVSPIWGLSLTEGLSQVIESAIAGKPAHASALDDEHTHHELWQLDDPAICGEVVELVRKTPVVVADGHHRYETAGHFRAEVRSANNNQAGDHDLVMALIVELTPEELFVQAIHRVVDGLPTEFDITGALAGSFEISQGPDDPSALGAALVEHGALGLITPRGNYFLQPTPALVARQEADLDSDRLDRALADLPPHELTYQHGVSNVAELVRNGNAQYAFLLRPATVEQIAQTAHGGQRMPPKTTFFNPKPRTGMVFRQVG